MPKMYIYLLMLLRYGKMESGNLWDVSTAKRPNRQKEERERRKEKKRVANENANAKKVTQSYISVYIGSVAMQ
jgi:hypothetical protein